MTDQQSAWDDRGQGGAAAGPGRDEQDEAAGTRAAGPRGDLAAEADGEAAEADGEAAENDGEAAENDGELVAGDDGSVVPLAEGLPDADGATLRDVDPAYGRRDVTGTPAL